MRRRRRTLKQDVSLNITSMMDMFTIILVFLLKTFASSSVEMNVSKNILLPKSDSILQPINVVSIIVEKRRILVNNKFLVNYDGEKVGKPYVDDSGMKIKPLYQELVRFYNKQKAFKSKYKGKIILQMDKSLPFSVLRQIMYTAGLAGFDSFKFLAISENS